MNQRLIRNFFSVMYIFFVNSIARKREGLNTANTAEGVFILVDLKIGLGRYAMSQFVC